MKPPDCDCQCDCECGYRVWTLDEWSGTRELSLDLTTYPGWEAFLHHKRLMWSVDCIGTGDIPDGKVCQIFQGFTTRPVGSTSPAWTNTGVTVTSPSAVTVDPVSAPRPIAVGLVHNDSIGTWDHRPFMHEFGQDALYQTFAGACRFGRRIGFQYWMPDGSGNIVRHRAHAETPIRGSCPPTLNVVSVGDLTFRLAVRCVCCAAGWQWWAADEFCIKKAIGNSGYFRYGFAPNQTDALHRDTKHCGVTIHGPCEPEVVVVDSAYISRVESDDGDWPHSDLARLKGIYGDESCAYWGTWFSSPIQFGNGWHFDHFDLTRAKVLWIGGGLADWNSGYSGPTSDIEDWLDLGTRVLVIDGAQQPMRPATGQSILQALGLSSSVSNTDLHNAQVVPTSHVFCNGVSGDVCTGTVSPISGASSSDVVATTTSGTPVIVAERWPGNTSSRVIVSWVRESVVDGANNLLYYKGLSHLANSQFISNLLSQRSS